MMKGGSAGHRTAIARDTEADPPLAGRIDEMLGKRLKKVRKEKKITQEEISNYLGVKRQTYSAYEREVSVPDSLTLKKLADYFGVSTDYFFLDESSPPMGANTPQEQKLLLLARRAERIPESQRERLFKSFEDNVDLYLEVMGVAKDGEE